MEIGNKMQIKMKWKKVKNTLENEQNTSPYNPFIHAKHALRWTAPKKKIMSKINFKH